MQDCPDPRQDLDSRAPNMVPYTSIGEFLRICKWDLLSRSAQGSAFGYQQHPCWGASGEVGEWITKSNPHALLCPLPMVGWEALL